MDSSLRPDKEHRDSVQNDDDWLDSSHSAFYSPEEHTPDHDFVVVGPLSRGECVALRLGVQ